MAMIKDQKFINNNNIKPNKLWKLLDLRNLANEIINEEYLELLNTLTLKNVGDINMFRKEIFSKLKIFLAEFLDISKNLIDNSVFNIDKLSSRNINKMTLEFRVILLRDLPIIFLLKLQEDNLYNSRTKILANITNIDIQNILESSYNKVLNEYKQEKKERTNKQLWTIFQN